MMRLRPNNTYRFTVCGNPKIIMRDPPPMIADRRPRQRFIIPIMSDDSIFFDEIDVGTAIAQKMLQSMVKGEFKSGLQRFEIRVNDASQGWANYYNVQPLDWEYIPEPSSDYKCEWCHC